LSALSPSSASNGAVTLSQCQNHPFSVGGALTDGTTVYSWNEFKKNPGSAGSVVQLGTGNPKPGVKVQLISPTKTVVGTVTTDPDGVWQILYKHTGKAANYTVKLPDLGRQQTVTLKANGFAIVNFDDLP
jgi:hypothetical protein